jgi:alcohol dehydrogenase, propanol-preferring
VTANTRVDGQEFLKLAGEIPIHTSTVAFGLEQANVALQMLKHDEIKGAGVLRVS